MDKKIFWKLTRTVTGEVETNDVVRISGTLKFGLADQSVGVVLGREPVIIKTDTTIV